MEGQERKGRKAKMHYLVQLLRQSARVLKSRPDVKLSPQTNNYNYRIYLLSRRLFNGHPVFEDFTYLINMLFSEYNNYNGHA